MALNTSNTSNLEQLALKWLMSFSIQTATSKVTWQLKYSVQALACSLARGYNGTAPPEQPCIHPQCLKPGGSLLAYWCWISFPIYYSMCSESWTQAMALNIFHLNLYWPGPYWSNPPFLTFDIRALWRSGLNARVPECKKLKITV